MARIASPEVSSNGLYRWLLEREEEAARSDGYVLKYGDGPYVYRFCLTDWTRCGQAGRSTSPLRLYPSGLGWVWTVTGGTAQSSNPMTPSGSKWTVAACGWRRPAWGMTPPDCLRDFRIRYVTPVSG